MIVRALFGAALCLGAVIAYQVIAKKPYDLRIELVTCQPDSVLDSWRAAYDKRRFWVEQHVVLEMSLERSRHLASEIDDCKDLTDPHARQECLLYHRNWLDAALKCKHHSKVLCREYGGFC